MHLNGTHCCGLQLLQGVTSDSDKLKTLISDAKRNGIGCIMATLGGYEKKRLGPFLEEHGFKLADVFHNPNSSHYVYTYKYHMSERQPRQRKPTTPRRKVVKG